MYSLKKIITLTVIKDPAARIKRLPLLKNRRGSLTCPEFDS
jgi:hypothetical protein